MKILAYLSLVLALSTKLLGGMPQSPPEQKVDAKHKEHRATKKYGYSECFGCYAQAWFDEDVHEIVTDEERTAFNALSNDEERDQFIEAFWLRRNPMPDTLENEFKEEHYRRIAYANENFGFADMFGLKSDRGKIYIRFGPPDKIEKGPDDKPRPPDEGEADSYPYEEWHYNYLDGIGQDVDVVFVDKCLCNDYRMIMDRSEKDSLFYVPRGYIGKMETEKPQITGKLSPDSFRALPASAITPQTKFIDLEQAVEDEAKKFNFKYQFFDVRTNFARATSFTTLTSVVVQMRPRDITFTEKEGMKHATINMFGQLRTISGHIAEQFEAASQIDLPSGALTASTEKPFVISKVFPLRPGRYRLDIAVKDVNGNRIGTWSRALIVHEYLGEGLCASSLVLHGATEPTSTKSNDGWSFPLRDGQAQFKRNEQVNVWMQVYNLAIDQKTKQSSAMIEYDILDSGNKALFHATETTESKALVSNQMTVRKTVSTENLKPGYYTVRIKVTDQISKQTIGNSGNIIVE